MLNFVLDIEGAAKKSITVETTYNATAYSVVLLPTQVFPRDCQGPIETSTFFVRS